MIPRLGSYARWETRRRDCVDAVVPVEMRGLNEIRASAVVVNAVPQGTLAGQAQEAGRSTYAGEPDRRCRFRL